MGQRPFKLFYSSSICF
uniref:Uncharacterized protein n=1 Tax=Arundo donax TaxID=35708 RepID=A0A0A9HXI5_ARUDO